MDHHTEPKPKTVAVFGGTFDPPTIAHEAIIRTCLDRTDIDEVWVMPSGQRLDKPNMLSNQARLAMLDILREQSFASSDKLIISDFELHLLQPTHTYNTVTALERAYPEHTFWFVFGADSYRTMHTWENGEELRGTLGMLLVPRAGEELPPEQGNIRHLSVPGIVELGLSSTQVREALYRDDPIGSFVSNGIAAYLAEHHSYQAA